VRDSCAMGRAMGREFCAAAALAMRLERDSRGDNEAQAASYADAGRRCPLRVFPGSIRKIVRQVSHRSVGCRLRDLVATEMQRDADADLVVAGPSATPAS
jgi:hypothetical protein